MPLGKGMAYLITITYPNYPIILSAFIELSSSSMDQPSIIPITMQKLQKLRLEKGMRMRRYYYYYLADKLLLANIMLTWKKFVFIFDYSCFNN